MWIEKGIFSLFFIGLGILVVLWYFFSLGWKWVGKNSSLFVLEIYFGYLGVWKGTG